MANEYKRPVVVCNECQGRNYADPTKPYHWPDCSQYRTWRFPPRRISEVPPRRGVCYHDYDNWMDCPGCTYYADYDDGGEGNESVG